MHASVVSAQERSRPRTSTDALARAVLAGFVASLTMLLLFLVAYNVARLLSAAPTPAWPVVERRSIIHPAFVVSGGGQQEGAAGPAGGAIETLRLWLVNLTHNRLIDASLNGVYLAAGIYLAGGVLWALLYTLVEPRLRGSPWQRGATFAMLPTLVSLVVVLPLFGGGLFGLALGAGPLPIIGNVLLHLAYGGILGVVYGPLGDLDASTLERPDPALADTTTGSFEHLTAVLLIGGLLLGGLAGLAVSLAHGGVGVPVDGDSNAGVILAGALLGATVGLFVGSFAGLGDRVRPRPQR
jgi:hypothetical protein